MQRYSPVLPCGVCVSGHLGAEAFSRLPVSSSTPFDRTSTDARFSSCFRTGVL